MATEWRMKGQYMKNCNCAPGCPCDFWASPTHHQCEGMAAMRIAQGNFGTTRLDGLIFAVTYHWPGPLHEGNGSLQPYVDERATEPQRQALLTIMSGKAGNAWFEVLASLVSTIHEPRFVRIEFEFDLDRRRARVFIPAELETVTEPIRNIATGDEHRAHIDLPNGMEYRKSEVGAARVLRGTGKIRFDCTGSHSSLAEVEHTQAGLIS